MRGVADQDDLGSGEEPGRERGEVAESPFEYPAGGEVREESHEEGVPVRVVGLEGAGGDGGDELGGVGEVARGLGGDEVVVFALADGVAEEVAAFSDPGSGVWC